MIITDKQLKQIAPMIRGADLSTYLPLLNEILPKWEINTPKRIVHFLAQVLHESGAFKYRVEIASGDAYEGHKDLGNIYPGDGRRFKGRGPIQTTGRNNYKAASLAIFGDLRLLKRPELLAEPRWGLEASCYYWKSRGLNELADKPETWTITRKRRLKDGTEQLITFNKLQYITLKVNGGQNGIEERAWFYNKAKMLLA